MANTYYSKFDTGSDITGDGSLNNPFKTIQKSIDSGVAGDVFLYLADEIITLKITLINTNSLVNVSVVSSANPTTGLIDGTRFKINGNSICDYVFETYPDSRLWALSNIEVINFTEFFITPTGNYVYYYSFTNIKLSNIKGWTNSILGFASCYYIDIEITNCNGGSYVFIARSPIIVKRIRIYNCSSTLFILYLASPTNTLSDVIINNCIVGQVAIFAGTNSRLYNIIIDRVTFTNPTFNDIIYLGYQSYLSNILITNCNSNNGVTRNNIIYTTAVAVTLIENVALFNNQNFDNIIDINSYLIQSEAPHELSEDPFIDSENEDYTLKNNYTYRRRPFKIGEFNRVFEILEPQ